MSYATVRDYCESADLLPAITGHDGDLKNVQRPWAVKAVLGCVAPPARVLEIGGGQPVVSGILSELGYEAILVDPYDGLDNGPKDLQHSREHFPHVRIVRDYFGDNMADFAPASFDVILSVSVLEHFPHGALASCFSGIAKYLRPGGHSVHCFDFIVQGPGTEHAFENARYILEQQKRLNNESSEPAITLGEVVPRFTDDLETFYLSPQGHHNWRGGLPYEQFPYRKVVSLQSVAMKS
ncbi:MAG: class I SAM-dependent methyltransferase [Chthoniobacterales bacterium]